MELTGEFREFFNDNFGTMEKLGSFLWDMKSYEEKVEINKALIESCGYSATDIGDIKAKYPVLESVALSEDALKFIIFITGFKRIGLAGNAQVFGLMHYVVTPLIEKIRQLEQSNIVLTQALAGREEDDGSGNRI